METEPTEPPPGPEWRLDLIREAAEKLERKDNPEEVFVETCELSEVL